MGAPKAADTPAAAPPDTKSLFSWSSRKYGNKWKSLLNVVDLPCDTPAATTAPACIMGPSLPQARPPATENITPTTLQNRVWWVKKETMFRYSGLSLRAGGWGPGIFPLYFEVYPQLLWCKTSMLTSLQQVKSPAIFCKSPPTSKNSNKNDLLCGAKNHCKATNKKQHETPN